MPFNCNRLFFSGDKKGVVSRKKFEWNKNEFCQLFQGTHNAQEFVTEWSDLTKFDVVNQTCYPVASHPENSNSHVSESHAKSQSGEVPAADTSNESV